MDKHMDKHWLRTLCGVLCAICWACAAHACLWDNDTLAMEAKGMPEVVHIIAGRFERNPPLYYQMRLERVTRLLATKATRPIQTVLAAYDDAGVACDRLGRQEEAIRWMVAKRAFLDHIAKMPNPPSDLNTHCYRYHANLGTFYAHRWIRRGANHKHPADLKAARSHIARAIEINPDAHFGREIYQLQIMDWLLSRREEMLEKILTPPQGKDHSHVTQGLKGLIVLGNAWESVDVFEALGSSLQRKNDSFLGFLAHLRSEEIARKGGRSFFRNAPYSPETQEQHVYYRVRPDQEHHVVREFKRLRAEAERWHAQRTQYMMARLQAGRHPDTDSTFWDDYRPVPPPSIRDPWGEVLGRNAGKILLAAGGVLLVHRAYRRWKRHQTPPLLPS